jgi:hypothetical protein
MLPTKFRFIWPRGFRGEEFKKSSNQKPVVISKNHLSGVSKWAGTFTRLRSCIVPAEITEPPPKLAVVKTTSTIGLWNIFHKKLMITSVAEFSHSNRTTAFSHLQTENYIKKFINCHLMKKNNRIKKIEKSVVFVASRC